MNLTGKDHVFFSSFACMYAYVCIYNCTTLSANANDADADDCCLSSSPKNEEIEETENLSVSSYLLLLQFHHSVNKQRKNC